MPRGCDLGSPGAHIVMTCAKNMQNSGDMHVVQLPLLPSFILCPVTALKDMVKYLKQGKEDPLFLILNGSGYKPLTAHRARSFLKLSVAAVGLNPRQFTFHSFRRSGATLSFDNDIKLDHFRQQAIGRVNLMLSEI